MGGFLQDRHHGSHMGEDSPASLCLAGLQADASCAVIWCSFILWQVGNDLLDSLELLILWDYSHNPIGPWQGLFCILLMLMPSSPLQGPVHTGWSDHSCFLSANLLVSHVPHEHTDPCPHQPWEPLLKWSEACSRLLSVLPGTKGLSAQTNVKPGR